MAPGRHRRPRPGSRTHKAVIDQYVERVCRSPTWRRSGHCASWPTPPTAWAGSSSRPCSSGLPMIELEGHCTASSMARSRTTPPIRSSPPTDRPTGAGHVGMVVPLPLQVAADCCAGVELADSASTAWPSGQPRLVEQPYPVDLPHLADGERMDREQRLVGPHLMDRVRRAHRGAQHPQPARHRRPAQLERRRELGRVRGQRGDRHTQPRPGGRIHRMVDKSRQRLVGRPPAEYLGPVRVVQLQRGQRLRALAERRHPLRVGRSRPPRPACRAPPPAPAARRDRPRSPRNSSPGTSRTRRPPVSSSSTPSRLLATRADSPP